MTVKEFAEYLLNDFDNEKEIVCQRWMGDADDGVFDAIDTTLDGYETVKDYGGKVVIK